MCKRSSSAVLCAVASVAMGGAWASACSTNLLSGIGSAIQNGCNPCVPLDGAPGGPGQPGTLDSAGRGGLPFEIKMVEFAFLPGAPIIRPNTTVRWDNNSLFSAHTTTREPTWNSGLVNPNDFFDFRFTAAHAGFQYQYICTQHFGMEAELNVAHFGDANLDGFVNLQDFNILAANFGATGTGWDQGDFNLLAGSFGKQIEPAPFTFSFGDSVPEPAGSAVLCLGAVILGRRRKGWRREVCVTGN